MPEIHELDAATVDRIAAGEVVERPASAVKELVENAIDADATRVEVAVEAGGSEGIRVSDDGIGMTREAVERAVREHTTSKIQDVSDLESGVGTLGFRGEALHAIGAVSRLTVRTRPRGDRDDLPDDAAETGTELVVEGGEVTSVERVGCPEGTTVEVEDLFYNVPARRKYLKRDATEFAHVNRVVAGYALANPGVAVSLTHDGRETFATPGQGDLRSAMLAVYGREVAEGTVLVGGGGADPSVEAARVAARPDDTPADADPDGPLDGVCGLVSDPETTRSGREYLNVYVNGRWVTARAVREAIVEAYGGQLAGDRYPFAALFLSLPAGEVDVNVHPRKREVRFADEEGVRRQVKRAVRSALLEAGLVRSSAPRGRSQPEQTEISPERAVKESDSLAGTGDEPRRVDDGRWQAAEADTTPEPGVEEPGPDAAEREARTDTDPGRWRVADSDGIAPTAAPDVDESDGGTTSGDAGDATGSGTAGPAAGPDGRTGGATPDTDRSEEAAAGARTAPGTRPASPEGSASGGTAPERADSADGADPHRRFRAGEQRTLGGEAVDRSFAFDRLPRMRVLGQLSGTYLAAETDDGLVLVDQHAADERVNYEALREQFLDGPVTTQTLAEPVSVPVTSEEAELVRERGVALERLGLSVALADGEDGRAVRVSAVPAVLAEAMDADLVRDLLADLAAGNPDATVTERVDALLGDMACYPAIKGNESLREGTVVSLLEALDDCENPYACPHGRPTLVEFDLDEIEDRFERDYPGHSHRRE
ncbi:DNA mismatch repair endonuclease MutL [Haloglomus litoreum]|uniref:DNA mismatch repair endonuclease MutL n=1 Tax=Haloglomus litoreum TaxID=3034026 RepID=UPI0023E78EDD|nr:DNA mismatch repair endonuclease MutL [Haloglomus sp. DT116]